MARRGRWKKEKGLHGVVWENTACPRWTIWKREGSPYYDIEEWRRPGTVSPRALIGRRKSLTKAKEALRRFCRRS